MSNTLLFTEEDGENIRGFHYYPETSVEFTTARQNVKILDTVVYGKTLFLNGILQSSIKDEEVYHRKLVHPILGHITKPCSVCVLGGGEGATVREVLKYSNVTSVTMIDWDEELVKFFRDSNMGQEWHKGALKDSRVHLEFADVFTILNEQRKYDVILVDLVDLEMDCDGWSSFLGKLIQWLELGGSLVLNAGGVLPWDEGSIPVIREALGKREEIRIHQYKCFVPSFGREWAFVQLDLIS